MQETITLAKPISLNGILVNQVTLREPTVGDHLAIRGQAPHPARHPQQPQQHCRGDWQHRLANRATR